MDFNYLIAVHKYVAFRLEKSGQIRSNFRVFRDAVNLNFYLGGTICERFWI